MALLHVPKKIKMQRNKIVWYITILYGCCLIACSPKNISSRYYFENEKALDHIEESYKALSQQKAFTVGFTNRSFSIIELQILTDSLDYIYEFSVNESRLNDTLSKYGMNPAKINMLIQKMKNIRCTWVKNFDYYVADRKQTLVFMSIKPLALQSFFSYKKYYTIIYFQRPQYFDSEGRLIDRRQQRRLRKINGEIFKRINDKVCYAISGKFR